MGPPERLSLARVAVYAACAVSVLAGCGPETLVPTILDFEPKAGLPGVEVTIRGVNFDRDAYGFPTPLGARAWQVVLAGRHELEVVDAGPRELTVVIPADARSGALALVEAGTKITESSSWFTVLEHPIIAVENDSQFDLVDLRLNGQQALAEGTVVESGGVANVRVLDGRYRIDFGLGEPKAPFLGGTLRTESAGPGSVVTVSIASVAVLDLLTAGAPAGDWVATFKDADGEARSSTLRFADDGTWIELDGPRPVAEGRLLAEPFGAYPRSVSFALKADGPVAKIAPPFTSFDLRSGPDHWPLLRYVRQ